MKRYWFEHWQQGQLKNIEFRQANSVSDAISKLSDEHKGVFLLLGSQTEGQRVKENWQHFYKVSGET